MIPTKRRHLEAAGWRVGSAAEFLDLSPDESAYVDLKVTLGTQLKAHRQQQHLTQVELAKRLHSHQSRVAKMETGDPSVSLDLLVRSLFALGVTPQELAHFIAPSA